MAGSWAASWAVNDIVTAAEFKKGVGMVADTTLGASAASIDLSSLPTTYAHMHVKLYLRGDTAAASTQVAVRFNNDSAANYFSVGATFTETASGFAGQTTAATSANCGFMPANTATASYFSSVILDIPYFANTVGNKVFSSTGYVLTAAGAGGQFSFSRGGAWAASAAINRITFLPSAGNFVTGSRATVYVFGA